MRPNYFLIVLSVLVGSCTNRPSPSLSVEETGSVEPSSTWQSEDSQASEEGSPQKGILLDIRRPGFHFRLPHDGWVMVSDPSDENATMEFFDPANGLRATLSVQELPPEESAQVSDRAQAELKSRENGATKVIYSQLQPLAIAQAEGMGWESSVEKDGQSQQYVGTVALLGNRIFTLALSGADQKRDRKAFLELFHSTFHGFQVDASLLGKQGPAVGAERIQKHHSTALSYSWMTTDTLWHSWTSLEALNTDPDLTLTDGNEDVSLFVYGASVDPNDISSRDLLHVFLTRLGLDPENPDMSIRKKTTGAGFVQDIDVIHVVAGYDFHYLAKFHYEDGRGILVATWTQEANFSKFSKAMQNAVNGLKMLPIPSGGLPEEARQKEFNARVVNQVGLFRLAEEQPLVALSYFEKANRMDPTEPLYLINCGFVYQSRSLFGPGIDHFQSQMPLVSKSGKLLAILGELYESLHDYNRAVQFYSLAQPFSPNDPELIINLSDAYWGIGQRTKSLEVVQELYRKQPSARLGVYVAKTLMGLDQYAEAVEFLYGVKTRFPMNRDLVLSMMDALTFLQRHQEALAISDELYLNHKDNAEVWTARGRTQFHLKQFRAAEISLQKAIAIKPENEEAKSFLSATKAFLGKADIRALQAPIAPVGDRPTSLKSWVKMGLSDSARADKFPAVVHTQEKTLKTGKTSAWVGTEQMLIEILDPRGTGLFQEFTYTFLAGYDRIYVNALEVYDSNWKLRTKWNVSQAYITYMRENGSTKDAQMAHLPLTNLQVGDFVYLQISRTSLENSGTVPFTHHMSSRDIPVGKDVFRLLADTNSIATEEYGPISHRSIPGGLEWSIEEPVVIRKEVFMPVYRDFGAGVLISGKQSWEQVGKDYQTMIQHQFASSIPIREKAFEIRGNRMQDMETIFQTADWVRQNIRYREVAFGGHSLIPSLSLVTMNERQGDCKDQSLLLKELLDVMGIPSKLALVNLEEPGSEALPTIQQFNHMILYVPASTKWPELWIDPTDKVGERRPIPLDLEGKVSMIVDGDSSRVVVTPILEKDQEHKAYLDHRIFIGMNGKAEFRDSLTLYGKFASGIRAQLLSRDPKEREKYLADWLVQTIPDVQFTSLKLENLGSFNKPLILIQSFSSANYFGKSPGKIQGAYPNIWERSFMRLPKVGKRHHPIRLPHETGFQWRLQVFGPDGFSIKLGATGKSLDGLDYIQMSGKPGNGSNPRSMQWNTLALFADASEYEKIRGEWEKVLQGTAPWITLEQ